MGYGKRPWQFVCFLCLNGVVTKKGGLYMTLKLGITVLLVVFIAGAVIWLNLRHRKK